MIKRRGDTIIEVLMSIAIIGLVLTASFNMVSKSTNVSTTTQERTEALKYSESQIEQMKSMSGAAREGLLAQITSFCLDAGVVFSSTNSICQKSFFSIVVTPGTAADSSKFFTVKTSWTPIGGKDSNKNEVKLVYRFDK